MDEERTDAEIVKLATVDGVPIPKAANPKRRRQPPKRDKKHPMMRGRKGWNPTAKDRKTIELCRAAGMTPEAVAAIIGVSPRTLQARAGEAMKHGAAVANSRVVSKLYQKCMNGDTIALLFWCKTRLGWQEKNRIEHTGADGGAIQLETVEAEANDFTQRILAMANRFEAAPAANEPGSEGELTQKSTEPPEVNKQGA